MGNQECRDTVRAFRVNPGKSGHYFFTAKNAKHAKKPMKVRINVRNQAGLVAKNSLEAVATGISKIGTNGGRQTPLNQIKANHMKSHHFFKKCGNSKNHFPHPSAKASASAKAMADGTTRQRMPAFRRLRGGPLALGKSDRIQPYDEAPPG
ncbi:MAG TPA: hypothetical protein VG347_25810 [Verrucomicrobiae bacterium]|nr:hypothetical protein [Verrucomicrobiae bacterium]